MAASASDLQRTLGRQLSTHVLEIDDIVLRVAEEYIAIHDERRNPIAGVHEVDHIHAVDRQPFGRLGHAEEVAQVVLFLCSPASNWITGDSLNVSGGFIA